MYNDSPPNASYVWKYGHTKGALAVNKDQGFWLIHSVPNYPPAPKGGELTRPSKRENLTLDGRYAYPDSGTLYGQSFLCVSFGSDQFDTVGKQLMYNEIIVYAKNVPDALGKEYPTLRNATNQKRIKSPPYSNKAVVKSSNSVEFTSFAKGGKWQKGS